MSRERRAVQLDFVDEDGVPEESRTKQSFMQETDINEIVRRGVPQNTGQPVYMDCTSYTDYMESIERVRSTQAIFDRLPSRVRAEYANDPANLIAVMNDALERPNECREVLETFTRLGVLDPQLVAALVTPLADPSAEPAGGEAEPDIPA